MTIAPRACKPPRRMAPPLLTLQNVALTFGGRPLLTDASMSVEPGERLCLVGRNGSGKSTLLRAVAGLIPPAGGRLWVAGEPSLLGVNAVLMNKLSGERNIQIGGQALGLSRAEIAERLDEIRDLAGDRQLIVTCKGGGRVRRTLPSLAEYGLDVANLEGGMKAWHEAGKAMESADGSTPTVA